MNSKVLEEIDFFKIRDEVAAFCVSEEGKNEFLQREPFTEYHHIEFLKKLSREWQTYLTTTHSSAVSGWEPVNYLIPIIKTTGAGLSLEQVKALGQFCVSVKKVQTGISNQYVNLELRKLYEQMQKLPDMSETEKKIFRVITPDGEMRDLPEIAAIRKEIASLNAKIKNIMRKFTSDQKYDSVLESNVPVLRNGRQVLAVKSSLQSRIPGIIHEVSQSAQTVYVEPEEAVICSNSLIQKENELQQVIKKILAELTLSLQPSIPEINTALPVMKLFDTTAAAAKWGIEHNCIYALPCKDEPPALVKATHPLLGEKAVPIDIRFMDGKRVLIITGPNTGGKTVTLKTFALFAMLNQTGIPLPAGEGTRLPVFSDIYADIGDSQSLTQSLSTFSGHMKNIAEAVKNAKNDSLILLDELGSGTDPQEGTAISMSVLDFLIEKKSFVLVTTHQGILKNYGYTNPSCINASVEFDQSTLSPSYHLLMGVPGESHALDIAEKSGLPKDICKSARNYIATEQADVSALIRGLNKKHVELNKVQREVEKQRSEFQDKYDRLKERELDVRKKEHDLKNGKVQELNDFLIHSRRTLENLVRTLKEGEITRDKTLGVKQFIADLEKNTQRLGDKVETEEEKLNKDVEAFAKEQLKRKHPGSNKKTKQKMSNTEALKYATPIIREEKSLLPEEPLKFQVGAVVTAGSGNSEGILISQEKKGCWAVQFGSVKMTMKEKDLHLVSNSKQEVLKASVSIETLSQDSSGFVVEKDTARPAFELRLLGMYSEEAIKALEKQIDLCILNNFLHFSVIHGKGDGVLQQAVRDYLSHCIQVESFEYAPAEDGGAGKTYVILKH